ncbi:MAG TPA: hypothetical protein VIV11_40325 [Kofleriaceae bacterium]
MRVFGVALLALIASCYSPAFQDCEVTCASGVCPTGFTCELGVCRSEGATGACGQMMVDAKTIDSDPSADNDMDGLINSMDNCEDKANADQANEDTDALGDVCDPCPIARGPQADLDGDGDGVGDACDPTPGSMNRLVVFEGFNAPPASNPSLLPTQASWSYANGKATVVNPGANVIAAMTWPQMPSARGDMVVSAFTINSFSPQTPFGAGVVQFMSASAGTGVVCWVARESFGDGLEMFQRGVSGSQVTFSYPIQPGLPTAAAMIRDSTMFQCSDSQAHTVTNTYSLTGSQFGIFDIGVGATFEYVMIVTRL